MLKNHTLTQTSFFLSYTNTHIPMCYGRHTYICICVRVHTNIIIPVNALCVQSSCIHWTLSHGTSVDRQVPINKLWRPSPLRVIWPSLMPPLWSSSCPSQPTTKYTLSDMEIVNQRKKKLMVYYYKLYSTNKILIAVIFVQAVIAVNIGCTRRYISHTKYQLSGLVTTRVRWPYWLLCPTQWLNTAGRDVTDYLVKQKSTNRAFIEF